MTSLESYQTLRSVLLNVCSISAHLSVALRLKQKFPYPGSRVLTLMRLDNTFLILQTAIYFEDSILTSKSGRWKECFILAKSCKRFVKEATDCKSWYKCIPPTSAFWLGRRICSTLVKSRKFAKYLWRENNRSDVLCHKKFYMEREFCIWRKNCKICSNILRKDRNSIQKLCFGSSYCACYAARLFDSVWMVADTIWTVASSVSLCKLQ